MLAMEDKLTLCCMPVDFIRAVGRSGLILRFEFIVHLEITKNGEGGG